MTSESFPTVRPGGDEGERGVPTDAQGIPTTTKSRELRVSTATTLRYGWHKLCGDKERDPTLGRDKPHIWERKARILPDTDKEWVCGQILNGVAVGGFARTPAEAYRRMMDRSMIFK